jgi:uncharacterized protein (TIGR02118 family)
MIKFTILFRTPSNLDAFERVYNAFLALVERMPEVERRQVNSVIGSPLGASPYYRVLEVYFRDQATMERAMMGQRGQEAARELNILPSDSFEMLFAEVYEETGSNTPTVRT